MTKKKLKYLQYLNQYPDCPCSKTYKEVEMVAYRWTHNPLINNDFTPLHLIKSPPARMLDDSDKMCKGFGLSMFDTLKNASNTYKKNVIKLKQHLRDKLIEQYGKEIAYLILKKDDGIAGDFNLTTGHFTFHEYESAKLEMRVYQTFNIFDQDGEFINYS